MGAPALSDGIWLYGGDKKTLVETIGKGRAGVMPSWTKRLDDPTIKQLAVYVHELGCGTYQRETADGNPGSGPPFLRSLHYKPKTATADTTMNPPTLVRLIWRPPARRKSAQSDAGRQRTVLGKVSRVIDIMSYRCRRMVKGHRG